MFFFPTLRKDPFVCPKNPRISPLILLLMAEILHHLGCINLVNNEINYISTGAGFQPFNSMTWGWDGMTIRPWILRNFREGIQTTLPADSSWSTVAICYKSLRLARAPKRNCTENLFCVSNSGKCHLRILLGIQSKGILWQSYPSDQCIYMVCLSAFSIQINQMYR